ncbi:MAG: S-layer homology domain-containing protein [Promicromonosporaceae bacterium]|nr:S-layer homology domain-containing protein [Promicromonosporaceae bacterium]
MFRKRSLRVGGVAVLALALVVGAILPASAAPSDPGRWPLTGERSGQVVRRPALAIKVDNASSARPQVGLEYADLVWEQLTEAGMTRFVAVYHSRIPDAVLPVRSARPVDISIVRPLNGVFAASGAQPRFLDMIRDAGIQGLYNDRGHPGFFRTPYRVLPNNVVGQPHVLLSQARAGLSAPPPAQFRHATAAGRGTASLHGRRAPQIEARMSPIQRTVWDWDAESRTYLRSNGTRPSYSYTEVRHAAANVVVLDVEVVEQFELPTTVLDRRWGPATVASGGRQITGIWYKPSVTEPIRLIGPGGGDILLEPGATWVNLRPRDPNQPTQHFRDVPASDQFTNYIHWLADQGISTGWPDMTFRPSEPVERQAMAAFLYRAFQPTGFQAPGRASFTDVNRGGQFFFYIEWLADAEIATGWPDRTFRPGQSIERQAMAAFLYRAAGSPEFEAPDEPTFSDVPRTDRFFFYIEWLADTGITTGWPDGTFRPLAPVERQAMAAFLHRASAQGLLG